MNTSGAIPVLMYHSVGRPIKGYRNPLFSMPARVFADQLAALSRAGYESASLDELNAHMTGDIALPPNRVVFTFDDGYLDNWTYVVPLLAKYGFKGTVFVTPEFVDVRDVVRPTLDDVGEADHAGGVSSSERSAGNEPENAGFMSWRELALAAERGVFAVECHGLTHAWFPTGPEVVDWHHPGDTYYWLEWNAYPDEKPFYLERLGESKVPWGVPVYAHGKSLEVTRYHPDPAETERLVRFVAGEGGAGFFEKPNWRAIIEDELEKNRAKHPLQDRYETHEERRKRYNSEMLVCKKRIEDRMGGVVKHFVFPGGAYL